MKSLFLVTLLSMLFLFGCISDTASTAESSDQKLKVLVSIPPQQEFVSSIVGDNADIILLVPAGASPHSYEPTPSQLAKISDADIYLTVGSGIEVEKIWVDKLRSLNPDMEIVDTSKGIALIEMQAHSHDEHDGHDEHDEEHDHAHDEHDEGHMHSQEAAHSHDEHDEDPAHDEHDEDHTHDEEHDHAHTGKDPHIWTSIKNAKVMVQNSLSALSAADAKNAGLYKENAQTYLDKLDSLDSTISSSLKDHKAKTFFVFHPAWGYFAKDYGLDQEAIENLGKEPTPQQLAQIVSEAKEDDVHMIFASPQFSTDSARVVAEQIDGEVILLDPLDKQYLNNTQKVAESLLSAFGDN